MARTVRIVSVPRGGTKTLGGGTSMRILAGSMGASPTTSPVGESLTPGVSEPFEAPLEDDRDFAREIAQREAALGLPPSAPPMVRYDPLRAVMPRESSSATADLSSLPPRFALEIERKDDRWKVTAPGVHLGLWKSGPDLHAVVDEALATLAEIVRVDGPTPAPKRRQK